MAVCGLGLGAALVLPSLFRDDAPRMTRTIGAERRGRDTSSSTAAPRRAGRSPGKRRPVPTKPPNGATTTRPTPKTGPAPVSSPSSLPPTDGPPSFTLFFGGDLLPHGPVNQAAAQAGRATGQAYDFDPLLAALEPLVSSADLAICHMETPIAPNQAQITTYPVFGAPVGLVRAIHDTGYDGCSTASNHSLDKGKAGIDSTISAFDFAGLGHAGTYTSAHDAARVQMYDVKGVKVAHLSYAYGSNGIPIPADAPYAVNQIDQARILVAAKRARRAGAQFVVVSLHWGNEYVPAPNAQQLALAPALMASPDIDLVVGHHVHVVQPIVREHGKFVVFGLGNQLSNQHEDLRRDGLSVLVTVTRGSTGRYAAPLVRAIPTYVDRSVMRVYPVASTLAVPSTPPGLRNQLQASFSRTMAVVNSRGVTPGVVAYDPARP